MSFYMDAHTKTMMVFIEGLRTSGRSLSELTTDTSSYQHFWTVYTPSSSASRGGPPSAGATADFASVLRKEIEELKEKNRRQQSEYDKKLDQVRKAGQGGGRGGNQTLPTNDRKQRSRSRPGDRGNRGNGDGKGKGKDRRR